MGRLSCEGEGQNTRSAGLGNRLSTCKALLEGRVWLELVRAAHPWAPPYWCIAQRSGLQLVAHPVDRVDQLLPRSHLLQLAPQVFHVAVHGAVGDHAVVVV